MPLNRNEMIDKEDEVSVAQWWQLLATETANIFLNFCTGYVTPEG